MMYESEVPLHWVNNAVTETVHMLLGIWKVLVTFFVLPNVSMITMHIKQSIYTIQWQ